MTETDLAIIAALRAGVTKALRDTRIAATFLIGKTDTEPDHPFWRTLATDVPGHKGWVDFEPTDAEKAEHDAYKRLERRFIDAWMIENFVPPGITLVEVDRDDLLEAIRKDGAEGVVRLLEQTQNQGGPSSEQRARWAQARAANLIAGKCLGCGGGMTEDGSCLGDGDADYDPDYDKTLRLQVSETGVLYIPIEQEPAGAKVARLRAQVDQLQAEDDELFRLTGEHDRTLAYRIGVIDGEIVKLTVNINDAKGI